MHKPEWNWHTIFDDSKEIKADHAGILAYAFHHGTVYILLGQEIAKNHWTDFTGYADKRDGDRSPFQTAAREFSEETNIIFYKVAKGKSNKDTYTKADIHQAALNVLEPKQTVMQGPILKGLSRGLAPFSQWQYFAEVAYIPAELFNTSTPGPESEMREFRWLPLQELLTILNSTKKNEFVRPFADSAYPLNPKLINSLLRVDSLLFLNNLKKFPFSNNTEREKCSGFIV